MSVLFTEYSVNFRSCRRPTKFVCLSLTTAALYPFICQGTYAQSGDCLLTKIILREILWTSYRKSSKNRQKHFEMGWTTNLVEITHFEMGWTTNLVEITNTHTCTNLYLKKKKWHDTKTKRNAMLWRKKDNSRCCTQNSAFFWFCFLNNQSEIGCPV